MARSKWWRSMKRHRFINFPHTRNSRVRSVIRSMTSTIALHCTSMSDFDYWFAKIDAVWNSLKLWLRLIAKCTSIIYIKKKMVIEIIKSFVAFKKKQVVFLTHVQCTVYTASVCNMYMKFKCIHTNYLL